MSNDLFAALDEPMAESWIADVDDKLVGIVTNLSSRDGGYGDYPIVTLEVEQGTKGGQAISTPVTLAVHCMTTAQKGEIWRDGRPGAWNVTTGDRVGFKYAGKKTGGSGNEYHAWVTRIERRTMADQLDADQPSLFG